MTTVLIEYGETEKWRSGISRAYLEDGGETLVVEFPDDEVERYHDATIKEVDSV